MQDKNIAISELKKLIEKLKGKGVDTNFEQPSILGKPPVQPIKNQPVVKQPSMKSSFANPYDVNAPGPSRNRPKNVSVKLQRESVGSNDMVHNFYLEEAKKNVQLQKDKDVTSKPSVITPARLPNTASDCKPKPRLPTQQPRNYPASMSSRVSNNDVHIDGKHRKQKPFLKSNDLACPICKQCIYNANHDECVLKYLSKFKPLTITSTEVPIAYLIVITSMIELGSLFGSLLDKYVNGENQVVLNSSVVTTADTSDKRQQQPDSTSSYPTLSADGNFDL
ncbi:hypothetical protein Tco_0112081 [Tanacetum coccineum]